MVEDGSMGMDVQICLGESYGSLITDGWFSGWRFLLVGGV